MRSEDLRTITQIGRALWANPSQSEKLTLDTFTAVSLLNLTPERITERTAHALLQRASRDSGAISTAAVLNNPFYRLTPEERVALTSLHLGRWSYARVARILAKTPEQVAELLWAARLQLISMPGVQIPAPHPTGSQFVSTSCPEYNPRRPWTQSFLDDETIGMDKVFIQNHLQSCKSCQTALSRGREFYFAVNRMIPQIEADVAANPEGTFFRQTLLKSKALKDPASLTLNESLSLFFEKRAVKWLLMSGVVFLILKRMH